LVGWLREQKEIKGSAGVVRVAKEIEGGLKDSWKRAGWLRELD
jgi:hypothetical protein